MLSSEVRKMTSFGNSSSSTETRFDRVWVWDSIGPCMVRVEIDMIQSNHTGLYGFFEPFLAFLCITLIFHKNNKNSIIVQQEKELTIYTTMNDNGRVWDGAVPSRPGSFIFFNFQICLF